MHGQVVKWGNSQGIRLSKKILEAAGIDMQDDVNIRAEKGSITIERINRHKTLEERAAAFGGKLGPYEETDWGEPVGREMW